jgi:hypothetical protein
MRSAFAKALARASDVLFDAPLMEATEDVVRSIKEKLGAMASTADDFLSPDTAQDPFGAPPTDGSMPVDDAPTQDVAEPTENTEDVQVEGNFEGMPDIMAEEPDVMSGDEELSEDDDVDDEEVMAMEG